MNRAKNEKTVIDESMKEGAYKKIQDAQVDKGQYERGD